MAKSEALAIEIDSKLYLHQKGLEFARIVLSASLTMRSKSVAP
jgi:hypothetical protein